jgi:nucleoid-associated protein YgaU
MAFPSLGPFNSIVEDFTKSLNNIFGLGTTGGSGKLGLAGDLVRPEGSGDTGLTADTADFDPTRWTGNTNRKGEKRLRYGFKIIDLKDFGTNLGLGSSSQSTVATYYLDIPPQAITQKEVFATNITATRRGVVVESEGVVFKDIVIAGTTGVFPGARDNFGGNQANFKDFTKPPTKAGGVAENGTSKSSTVISGYAEFMALRAFFLKYAQSKIQNKGSKFLVFINEKDQQALVVEPLEFNMERSSKNPMQYQYRIVLKCITTLDAVFSSERNGAPDVGGILNNIVNISRNTVAAINQFRAAVGATNRLVQSVSQEIDKTFIQPLRLLGTALNDLADARDNILAVPAILRRNLNESILTIQENRFTKPAKDLATDLLASGFIATTAVSGASANNPSSIGKISTRGSADPLTSTNLLNQAKADSYVTSTISALESSSREPLPKSFVQSLRDEAQKLADDIADAVNLGNEDYDVIQNRTPTIIANPLRQATSNEFLLLGATIKVISALNQVLATNSMFLTDTESTFENDQELLQNIVELQSPASVKEIVIMQGDTLERISLREYGTVTRWVDLAVLNSLKYPYIAQTKADGVKAYGDKLMVGN